MSESGERVFEDLLHAAERAALAGKTGAALAVLRALTRQFPHEARGWRALAELSDDADERRGADERASALDPPRTRPESATPIADAPYEQSDEGQRQRVGPWALYAVALVLLLAVAIPLFRLWRTGDSPPGSPPDLGASAPSMTASPTLSPATSTALPTAPPTVQPTTALSPTPQPTLALGVVAQRDGWGVSLLRPDYSLFLNGALGDQKPRGRFLLVLLALANGGAAPQPFPASLLVLHDAQGRSYTPPPGLSTAYLTTYGRGQRGDLSLENPLPAGGGLYSVPVIYDVPTDASGLQLSLGDAAGEAWPIGP